MGFVGWRRDFVCNQCKSHLPVAFDIDKGICSFFNKLTLTVTTVIRFVAVGLPVQALPVQLGKGCCSL
jgi:hypothetical protein